MRTSFTSLIAIVASCVALAGQTPRTFDVASVKLMDPATTRANTCGERWVLKVAHSDGRLGPGIRRAVMECLKTPQNAPVSERLLRPGRPVPCGQARDGETMAAGGVPFTNLLIAIRLAVGAEVNGRTGLTGLIDYYARIPRSTAPGPQDAEGVSIFTAVQEQLGMTLEREDVIRPALIIERVSRTTPN